MSQTVPNVDIAYIEAIITCPRCGNPGEFQSPEDQTGVHAGSKFMCVACGNVFEIYIRRPTRAAELPLEPTTGQDFSSVASDEIKIQIRLGRNNHLVKEETCPRNAGRINIYLPDNIEEIENSEKS